MKKTKGTCLLYTSEKIYEIMGLEEKIHIEQVLPLDIERRSFEIIGEELKAMGKKLEPELAPVIMRAIHTTADFDYADHLKFSEDVYKRQVWEKVQSLWSLR